jgi:hypothetical protein
VRPNVTRRLRCAGSIRSGGPLVCAVTGQVLSWDNAHVDHAPPVFAALADDWAVRVGGYPAIGLTPAADGQMGRTLMPVTRMHGQVFTARTPTCASCPGWPISRCCGNGRDKVRKCMTRGQLAARL